MINSSASVQHRLSAPIAIKAEIQAKTLPAKTMVR
jgi:hypothetical protein